MAMSKVLILGKGFIGNSVSNYFEEINIDHDIYSHSMLKYTEVDTFNKFLEDNKQKYEVVINAFGYTGRPNIDSCELHREDCWNWNVMYPLDVIKTANDHKLPVIHINTGSIYDGYEKVYTEEDKPNAGLFADNSSFYSKTKHASEIMLEGLCVYILRIRLPFTHSASQKNYFTKILKYNNLTNELNSLTSVTDFNNFLARFLVLFKTMPGGIYNVVNPTPVNADQITDIMKSHGLENKNWNFIESKELKTLASRSNCVLSTEKIERYNLPMPDAIESINRDIKIFKNLV